MQTTTNSSKESVWTSIEAQGYRLECRQAFNLTSEKVKGLDNMFVDKHDFGLSCTCITLTWFWSFTFISFAFVTQNNLSY